MIIILSLVGGCDFFNQELKLHIFVTDLRVSAMDEYMLLRNLRALPLEQSGQMPTSATLAINA